ncbi:MAG: NifU family protein [Bacteroidia bacterium]|nr:NifU family protein [Bacteroidia bacterium]MCZ2277688.1 NifU family protein [Bacteroidia bacterium]
MQTNNHALLESRVEAALEEIRPYLHEDEGDVKLLGITDDMIVRLRLLGACSSCNMSMMTMKAGIEQAILRAVPEIKGVAAEAD